MRILHVKNLRSSGMAGIYYARGGIGFDFFMDCKPEVRFIIIILYPVLEV